MRKCHVIISATLFAISLVAPVNAAERAPQIIIDGLLAYKTDGAGVAVATWLKGSALSSKKTADRLEQQLQKVGRTCGQYRGYETVHVNPFSDSARFVYMQLNYGACPLFGRFVVYNTGRSWVLTQVNFNANPEKVLPPQLLISD
ncbi:MAG: hypothetical protein COB33_001715 [Thiotrichaceae bacterium]|nr:hypothetical protein [Thiotrichaceae bacterium]PCI13595.1 MAG: hypothetical protein COB71_05485 [Thiotrichales bacterium]